MVDTYERNKLTVTIYYDEDAESPRKWDNFGTMICSHKNYILGDEQFNPDDYDGWEGLKQHLIKERGAVIVLPLGLYDHSGITMYVGDSHDRWDGGQVGFIYCTQEAVDQYKGTPEENLKNAEACLKQEVETYDHYLTGEVYGFTIINQRTGEEVDSCWDFYDLEQIKQEANDVCDGYKHPHEAAYAKSAREMHG
jgi:hypothetical protein